MGSMKDKRKNQLAPPFATETRDVRFAGTFEVLVPVPERLGLDVDRRDLDVHDGRDLVGHRVEHRLDRAVVCRELDQAENAIDAAITAVMDMNDRACCHGVQRDMTRVSPAFRHCELVCR